MRMKEKIVVLVVLIMGLSSLTFYTSGEEEKTGDVAKIVPIDEDTELFGGGHLIGIKFGEDAKFGVIYGTQTNKNTIYTVAVAKRYIGGAEVYYENGTPLYVKRPVFVESVYATRLGPLMEYNDSNSDNKGILNFQRVKPDDLDNTSFKSGTEHEKIYKGVALWGAWSRSDVKKHEGDTWKTWEFSLTRVDLPYRHASGTLNETNVLEKLQFTFHLNATVVKVEGKSFPVYNITVKKEGDKLVSNSSTVLKTGTYNGNITRYKVKVDHLIEGWDFDTDNQNPRLLLETGSIVATHITRGAIVWAKHTLQDKKSAVKATIPEESGDKVVSAEDADNETVSSTNPTKLPVKLKHPRIQLGDDWNKVGNLTWVTDAKVTWNDTETVEENGVYFQVQGYRAFVLKIPPLAPKPTDIYAGFVVLGGFNYPGTQGGNISRLAEKIVHDPEAGAEGGTYDIEEKTYTPPPTVPKPELVGISISKSTVQEGETITFKVTVKNSGDAEAGVKVLLKDGTTTVKEWPVTIKIGESLDLSQNWTAKGVGKHTFNVELKWANDTLIKNVTSDVDVTKKPVKPKPGIPGFELLALIVGVGVSILLLGRRKL